MSNLEFLDSDNAKEIASIAKWFKRGLAIAIIYGYFHDSGWLFDLVVASTILMLLFPFGNMLSVIEKVLGANLEIVNNNSSQSSFYVNEKLKKLEEEISELKNQIEILEDGINGEIFD